VSPPASGAVRAILFDLDGVLLDSFDAWLAVVNDVAERFGAPGLDRTGLALVFGQGIEEDARTLYPGHGVAEIRAAYEEAMPRHVARMQVGVKSLSVLERLGARGIRRAVVTNTQASLAARILEATGLSARIDAFTAVDGRLREKPHPDLLVEALRQLAVDAGEAVMVGDSRYDAEAASAAQVRFQRYDLRTGDDLDAALAPWLDP
jgi:AHBA synthesis associated protein